VARFHRFAATQLLVGLAAAGTFAPLDVRADTGDVVVAEALFRDGKELLAQKDYARACPKLAESYRRDPATGTLLALAMCHEREGRLASAWGEYADVASRSKLEARPDREKAARAKATELEPAVSRLTIALAEDAVEIASLEVKYNGVVLKPALFGTALPVDGGIYTVEASAPGKKKWLAKVAVASSGERRSVRVPVLEDADAKQAPLPAPAPKARVALPAKQPPAPHVKEAPPAPPVKAETPEPVEAKAEPQPEPVPEPPPASTEPRRGWTGLQKAGLVTGGAGVVGLGVGAFFTFLAVSKNNDSKSNCFGDMCTPAGKKDRLDARSAGNVATISLIGGGALTAAGAAMLIFGRGARISTPGPAAFLEAVPMVSPDGVGGVFRGTF
jgi:hypothetical protein